VIEIERVESERASKEKFKTAGKLRRKAADYKTLKVCFSPCSTLVECGECRKGQLWSAFLKRK
jgi:hypothetical protein